MPSSRLDELMVNLAKLSEPQLEYLGRIVTRLGSPGSCSRNQASNLVTDEVLRKLGDVLRIHHCLSSEPFTKDRFEYALVAIWLEQGLSAALAKKGNPGHDVTLEGLRFSLKTQADRGIEEAYIYISKYMELGKGRWETEGDLKGLLNQFLEHLKHYDRIFSLRAFSLGVGKWRYELVEIPKKLLLNSESGKLEMRHDSKQIPKPGYCTVRNNKGDVLYQLYFDGGTERKLQVKKLQKQLCVVHAEWAIEGQ